jgi:hypothetical protein
VDHFEMIIISLRRVIGRTVAVSLWPGLYIILLCGNSHCGVAWARDVLRPIVLSKAIGWTPNDGVFIGDGYYYTINNFGQVYFTGNINGPTGAPTGEALWRYEEGRITSIALPSAQVQFGEQFVTVNGDGGVTSLNDSEHILIRGQDILWLADQSGVRNIVMPGRTLSGYDAQWLGLRLENCRFNAGGRVLFQAELRRPLALGYDRSSGVWLFENGVAQLVAAENQPLPGLIGDEKVRYLDNNSLGLNEHGDTTFIADLTGVNGTGFGDTSLWIRNRDREPNLVVRSGNSVKVNGKQHTFSRFREPLINDHGQILFKASLVTPPLTREINGL